MVDTIITINREVSRELGFSEDLVKKVNKFYWEQGVKDSIRSAQHTNIRIRGLGTFATSKFKLYADIKELIKFIRNLRENKLNKKFKNTTREELIELQLAQLRKLLFRRNELAKAHYIKQVRYHAKLKNTKTNLEK